MQAEKNTRQQQGKTKIESEKKVTRKALGLSCYILYIYHCATRKTCVLWASVCVIFRCNCTLWLPLLMNRAKKKQTQEEWNEKIIHFQMCTFMFGFKCIFCIHSHSWYLFVLSDFLVLFFCAHVPLARLFFTQTFFISYVAMIHVLILAFAVFSDKISYTKSPIFQNNSNTTRTHTPKRLSAIFRCRTVILFEK